MVATPVPYSPATGTMPGYDGFVIVSSDSANNAIIARAIYVGGAGNVALVTPGGTTLTFVGVLAGTILPIMCTRVNATNTTASSMIGII